MAKFITIPYFKATSRDKKWTNEEEGEASLRLDEIYLLKKIVFFASNDYRYYVKHKYTGELFGVTEDEYNRLFELLDNAD